jgi:3-methyladenine DNA glycosylase AlkC
MDRTITEEELDSAHTIIINAIKRLDDILDDVKKEAQNDYNDIEKICNRLILRTIRLWHKYTNQDEKYTNQEEQMQIINSSPS